MTVPQKDKVRKIGGRLYDAYMTIERELDSINEDYFPLLEYLGLIEDVQKLVDILNSESLEDAIKEAYTAKEKSKIKFSDDEEQAKREEHAFKAKTVSYLRGVLKAYCLQTNVLLYPTHNKKAIEAYREALYTEKDGIHLNATKFIEMYASRLEVEKSDTKKLHEEVAEKIMSFFNGVPITKEELTRYFILDGGVVTINPKSVNAQDYARLGRTYKKGMAQNSEQTEVIARGGGNRKKSNT